MRYIRVKTTITFECISGFKTETICCHRDNETGSIIFCDEKGNVAQMVYRSLQHGMKTIDAMDLLLFPFDGDELKEGVEYCENPWE